MQERKKPFRKVRIAEDICVQFEKLKRDEGHRGSFNSFIESKLARAANRSSEFTVNVPAGTKTLDHVLQMQQQILDLLASHRAQIIDEVVEGASNKGERVPVKAHRPAKENGQQQRKAI